MVSFNVYRSTFSGAYVEGVCLASDEKPVVGIANGSILFAVDVSTGETTRYMYDQESMSWIEAACPCSGGGSGGGGGGGALVVTCSDEGVLDKTWKEIHDALAVGASVVVQMPAQSEEGVYLRDNMIQVVSDVGHIREYGEIPNEQYWVNGASGADFSTVSENGYPAVDNS